MAANRLTITAYSTALYSTWIFVEEMRLLLDAGDGVCAGLTQKSRKIAHVAVTHPDRDHVAGLFQLHQLNARAGVGSADGWEGCGVLIHESTFLNHGDAGARADRNQHSALGDVMRMAGEAKPGALILNHFSSRYTRDEVFDAVLREADKLAVTFPVYIIPPGQIVYDVLAKTPIGSVTV